MRRFPSFAGHVGGIRDGAIPTGMATRMTGGGPDGSNKSRGFAFPALMAPNSDSPTLVPLTADDAAMLARVHRDAFGADGEHWDADAFRSLLRGAGVHGTKAVHMTKGSRRALSPRGFVLVREVAGDAEILTLAVHPSSQGRGVGRELMEAALRELYARRAVSLYLEVEEDNLPAIRLYRRLGFEEIGRREGYYARASRANAAAVTMRLDL